MERSPQFGRRLLSHLIDERAESNHERPYASIARTINVQDGFEDISYARFANAINRAAAWLTSNFGSRPNPQTIMYMGSLDLRYAILALGAVKSNHVMFFPSLRNTPDALQTLLGDASCDSVVTTKTPLRPIQVVLDRNPQFNHVVVPEMSFFLDETPVEPIRLHGTFDELRYKPWIIIHTSGSTGNSKLVSLRHGYATAIDAFQLFDDSDTYRLVDCRLLMPFPLFHVAGITYALAVTCYFNCTVTLPPAGAPLTADLIHSMHRQTPVDHYILAPSLVSDLAKNQEYLAWMGRLRGLTYSGGPLPGEVAKAVAEKTKISPGFGATEYGTLPLLPRDPEDWQYFRFNTVDGEIELREVDQEGLFELVFVRRASLDLSQGIFVNFPHLDEYHTKDLFSKHPFKSGLYKYESRLDDIMVLSNGENIGGSSLYFARHQGLSSHWTRSHANFFASGNVGRID